MAVTTTVAGTHKYGAPCTGVVEAYRSPPTQWECPFQDCSLLVGTNYSRIRVVCPPKRDCSYITLLEVHFFFSITFNLYLNSYAGGFTLSHLLDKLWSQVLSSPHPPRCMPSFLSRTCRAQHSHCSSTSIERCQLMLSGLSTSQLLSKKKPRRVSVRPESAKMSSGGTWTTYQATGSAGRNVKLTLTHKSVPSYQGERY